MTIDQAVRDMFPTGLLHEPRINQGLIEETFRAVREIGTTLEKLTSLQISHWPRFDDDRYFSFAATLAPAPRPDTWLLSFDNPAKLALIAQSVPRFRALDNYRAVADFTPTDGQYRTVSPRIDIHSLGSPSQLGKKEAVTPPFSMDLAKLAVPQM